ncbi:MAG: ribonuclease domain-containing protein [Anaerolineae bacterium]
MANRRPTPQRNRPIIALLAILIVVVGLAAWAMMRDATPAPAPATATPFAAAATDAPRHEPTAPAATAAHGTGPSPQPTAPTALATGRPASARPGVAVATATPRPPAAVATSRPAATPTAGGLTIATPLPGDRMRTIRLDQLPAEAHETIGLIARGGPFPYRQDGVVFENREGRLPRKPAGYYREYTVVTPGSADRGARRLVRGEQGELYYTDDHYASFRRVVP